MVIEWNQSGDTYKISVLGETLTRDRDGSFLLPGRLVVGLRTDELPADMRFRIVDQLPSGTGFYQEDTVTFQRRPDKAELAVEVTTHCNANEWDGWFPLQATMDARRRVVINSADYTIDAYEETPQYFRLSFRFSLPVRDDLESILEEVCCKTRWVEEKGNEQLLFGRWST